MLVDVLDNISSPEFLGPFNNDTDVEFYFVCRVYYTLGVRVSFDVSLEFDYELLEGVAYRTVSSDTSFDVIFTAADFVGHYGKLVCHPLISGGVVGRGSGRTASPTFFDRVTRPHPPLFLD